MSDNQFQPLIESVRAQSKAVEDYLGGIDDKMEVAEKKMDDFIAKARSEYIRFTHFVPLDTKLVIPPLGLSEQDVEAYEYATKADYAPKDVSDVNCFGDIPEFAKGFNQLPIPDGMTVYLHLLVNVAGHPDITQSTSVHMLRWGNGALNGFYNVDPTQPFILKNKDNTSKFIIEGRDWGDAYIDRNVLPIGNFSSFNSKVFTTLRILNLGIKQLEIFGVGVEVRA